MTEVKMPLELFQFVMKVLAAMPYGQVHSLMHRLETEAKPVAVEATVGSIPEDVEV